MHEHRLMTHSLIQMREHSSLPKFITFASRPLEHINCILEASEKGALYLGDILSIRKTDLLQKYQIGAILSCMPQNEIVENSLKQMKGILHKKIPALDSPEYPISLYFQQCSEFIDEARKSHTNILVHCHAGVSRSATIVCAYLMRDRNWDLMIAFDFLKKRRERVRPNMGFIEQLKKYSSELQGRRKQYLQVHTNQQKMTLSSLEYFPKKQTQKQSEQRTETQTNRFKKKERGLSLSHSLTKFPNKKEMAFISSVLSTQKCIPLNQKVSSTINKLSMLVPSEQKKSVQQEESFGQKFKSKMSLANFKRVDRLASNGEDKQNRNKQQKNGGSARRIKSINKQYKIDVTQRQKSRENVPELKSKKKNLRM